MKYLLRFAFLLVLTGLTGCASLYFPPPPHAPMLTHQGEFYGAVSTNQHTNYAIQGAYGLTNHLAVAGTFSSLHRKKSAKTEDIDFGEASLGYFTRLPDKRVLEVYVGAGGGATQRIERNDAQIVNRTLDGSLSKIFAQVNYAKKKQNSLHLFNRDFPLTYGAAMRLSYMQLNNFTVNGLPAPGENNIFFEPITFTRTQIAGPVQLQLISGQIFGLRNNEFLKAANSVFQVGIVINLDKNTTLDD
ncbi:hypothetical protein Q5H92_09055 [Hymenobacter sp. M29]|uniref:Lipid/polyisoprenoid-binding YceI-like domain-containing protein n=1 Tax=Hymenobacter mellowenesis TaxID=3063995 RepID=A0ABT9A9J2_9BACT|nr:hypothetical protein [Hymenobacter sp. M29]MDO7846503.1 hypothetical protein [Hymenobacter sp. M29]